MTWKVAILVVAGCGFQGRHSPGSEPDAAVDAPPDAPAKAWFDDAWTRRNAITIHIDRLNAALAGYPLASYPALVRLAPTTIDYATIKAGGADLRFVLDDNVTVVPYDVDTFVAGGTSELWVRIPMIDPTAATPPHLWLYHGNPDAPAAADAPAVFAPSYVSVHHLGASYADVTGHGHTGTPSSDEPNTLDAGSVGEARDFDGVDESITLAGEPDYDFTSSLAVSAWIQVSAFSVDFQALVCKGDDTWRLHRQGNTNFIGFGTNSPGDNSAGTVDVRANAWRHVAVVYTGTAKQIYVDGALDHTDPYAKTLATDNTPVSIGLNATATTGGTRLWKGGIDEVRISAQPRTAAWLAADHAMVTDNQLVTIAADEQH